MSAASGSPSCETAIPGVADKDSASNQCRLVVYPKRAVIVVECVEHEQDVLMQLI